MVRMILAADNAWGIGNTKTENGLPWEDIPEDFKHFQKITKQYINVVMGKNTWLPIFKKLGKPLPGRKNYVLSRSMKESPHPDVLVFDSIEAFQSAIGNQDYCVIGGAETYLQFAEHVDEIILTRVHGAFEADCHFPASLLEDFNEDTSRTETLRQASEGKPAATVHYYKRQTWDS